MNARESGLELGNGNAQSRRVISEFSVGRRIVGPIIVLIALMLGTAQWFEPGRDGAALSAAQQDREVPSATEKFEYFPAHYVNQATKIEEHIQAF